MAVQGSSIPNPAGSFAFPHSESSRRTHCCDGAGTLVTKDAAQLQIAALDKLSIGEVNRVDALNPDAATFDATLPGADQNIGSCWMFLANAHRRNKRCRCDQTACGGPVSGELVHLL